MSASGDPKLYRSGTPGLWQLTWPDGVCVLVRLNGSETRWSASIPFYEGVKIGGDRHYQGALALPDVETTTMRELVQILTEWRQRELAAAEKRGAR